MFFEQCDENKKVLGFDTLCQIFGVPIMYVLTPSDFSLTIEEAKLFTNWQNLIQASDQTKIYPSPKVKSTEGANEDNVYDETPTGEDKVRDGKIKFIFNHSNSPEVHKRLRTHIGKGGGIIIGTQNNILLGYSDDDANLKAFTRELLDVRPWTINDGSKASVTPVYVVLADTIESQDQIVSVKPTDFGVLKLKDLKGALIQNAVYTSGVGNTVDFKAVDAIHGKTILGLTTPDIVVKDATGTAIVGTLSYDSSTQKYTFDPDVDFTQQDYTIEYATSDVMVLKGYNGENVLTFTAT
jgi:hypothetical protein